MQTTFKRTFSGKTVFFLSLPRHDAQYTSTPWQLAKEIAKDNKVVFTDNPFTFLDLIKGLFTKQIWKRVRAYWSSPVHINEQGIVVILSPFVFPINFLPKGWLYKFFSAWNQRILARRVNQYFSDAGTKEIIYINSFNFYFPGLYRYLNVRKVVNIYHCLDPMIKPFTLRHGSYLQLQAAGAADAIVTTSDELRRYFEQRGFQNTYCVPNGASFELFSTASATLKTGNKKVIGYLGNIERRIDYQLLMDVIEELQDWQCVMAGPVEKQFVPEELLTHERVQFTGPVSYQQAPRVVAGFDVAIIPFKRDEVSKSIYPLKLYEYMAAGKPVVSTDFNPEIFTDMPRGVYTTGCARDFADAIRLAYSTDDAVSKRNRIEQASHNSWEQRAVALTDIIQQFIPQTEKFYVTER